MRSGLTIEELLGSCKAYALPVGLSVLIGPPVFLLAWAVPSPLVLPAVSLGFFAIAAAAAATAWVGRAKRTDLRVTTWDVAGAFVLIGCAAAMLSQPENVLRLFGHTLAP